MERRNFLAGAAALACILAAEAMAQAVVRAARTAKGIEGMPAAAALG